MHIVYKRQNICNQTTTCTTSHNNNLLWKIGEIIQVKCKIGLWFLSSVLPLINIYVCTKFNFNPFVLFKIWPAQSSIMKNKCLWGDSSVNIQGRIMVLVHCPSPHCHLSINQVSIQSLLYFPRYRRTGNHYEKWLRGDNSINKQGRIMVHVHCPSSPWSLSINQVSSI